MTAIIGKKDGGLAVEFPGSNHFLVQVPSNFYIQIWMILQKYYEPCDLCHSSLHNHHDKLIHFILDFYGDF